MSTAFDDPTTATFAAGAQRELTQALDEGIDMSDPAIVEKLGRKGQLELEIETYERILVKYGKELFHPEAVVSSWWLARPPFKLLLLCCSTPLTPVFLSFSLSCCLP